MNNKKASLDNKLVLLLKKKEAVSLTRLPPQNVCFS